MSFQPANIITVHSFTITSSSKNLTKISKGNVDGGAGVTHLVWCMTTQCRVGDVVVSLLATGPKGRGFEAGQGNGFLRVIKTRNTPSFRMGNKAGGPMS
jgi:hypothetical protein